MDCGRARARAVALPLGLGTPRLTAPRSAPARPRFREQRTAEGSQVLEDSAFSDEFCRFLQSWVPSVEAAEVLLALAGAPLPAIKPGELDAQRNLKNVTARQRDLNSALSFAVASCPQKGGTKT